MEMPSDHSHEQNERNMRVVRRWVDEVWNQGRFDLIDDLTTPDYVLHYFSMDADLDLPTYKKLVGMFAAAFTDIAIDIEDILVDGDMVTVRLLQKVTHVGELMGVAPTGKQVSQRAIAIYRVADGRLAEGWAAENAWQVTLAALHGP